MIEEREYLIFILENQKRRKKRIMWLGNKLRECVICFEKHGKEKENKLIVVIIIIIIFILRTRMHASYYSSISFLTRKTLVAQCRFNRRRSSPVTVVSLLLIVYYHWRSKPFVLSRSLTTKSFVSFHCNHKHVVDLITWRSPLTTSIYSLPTFAHLRQWTENVFCTHRPIT